jgi:hypothetical protein
MHSLRSMNNTATWTYYHCMHAIAKAHAESTHGQVLVWPVGCLSTDSRERLLVRVGNFDCVCHGSGGGGWPQTCLKVKQWCMGALHHQSPPMQQLGTPLQVISLAKDLRQMPSPQGVHICH